MADPEGDDTIAAALQYVVYAFKRGSGFAGTVQFQVSDNEKGRTYIKSIQVKGEEGVVVHDGAPDGAPIDCVVKVEKTVLLAILTGVLEPPIAFMFGQISADNIPVLTNFVGAFEFRKDKFEEFQQSLAKQVEVQEAETSGSEVANESEKAVAMIDNRTITTTTSQAKTEATENGPNPSITSPRTKELKQNLAIGGLKLIVGMRSMAKEVDAFFDRVKDDPQLQKAITQMKEETAKLQATEGYQKLQTNAAFNTLKFELEKASIGVSAMTSKAMDKGLEVVETLTKTAYPTYVPTAIDLSVPLPDHPPPLVSSPPRSFWAPTPSQPLSPLPSSSSSPTRAPSASFSLPPPTSSPASPSRPAVPPTTLSSSLPPSTSSSLFGRPRALSTPSKQNETTNAPLPPPTSPSSSKLSFFQSLKTVFSLEGDTKEEKEKKEKKEKAAKEEKERKEKEAKEKEGVAREAKEKAIRAVKEKEERQREEKRKQLQEKLEELKKKNEEVEKQIQEETRKRMEELEEKRKREVEIQAQKQAAHQVQKEEDQDKEEKQKQNEETKVDKETIPAAAQSEPTAIST